MTPQRQVYLLDPQKLNPETIAVAFARTSRSPKSFREIAAELTDEKTAEFHEKWVIGYGHASVAEHAVLHIAVENISRLAVETLESNRLASYSEKSTRYQKWKIGNYYIPSELENHPLRSLYQQTCDGLFAAYQQSLPLVKAVVAADNPRLPDESDSDWEQRIRSDYIDACRYILPAASLANVGVTINARALEHALRKMLSHPLEEVRALGAEIKSISQVEIPTLIKYVEPVPYLETVRKQLTAEASQPESFTPTPQNWCQMINYDPKVEEHLLAAALYRFGQMSYQHTIKQVQNMIIQERQKLAQIVLGSLDAHDIPLRELEHAVFTIDLLLDQGAYFELKRHRMMTQTAQSLTTRLGYALPRLIASAGFETQYRQAMQSAQEAYEQLAAFNPDVASYVVPNAFNRRVLLTFNLRSADHLFALRTAPNAHFGIRRVTQRMAEEIRTVLPLLGELLRCSTCETWQDIQSRHFLQVM